MSALAGLILVFGLPAIAGCVLLAGPRSEPASETASDPTPDILLARGLACGLAVWLLGSGLLARTVGVTDGWAWAWAGLVGVLSVAALLLPRSRARIRATLEPAGRRLAVAGGLTALVFAPLAFIIVRTSWSPIGSTPWYYYGLAQQVADAGEIPATSIEFATTTPFLNDYHLFTTGTATLLVQDPGGPMTVITVITLIGALLLGVGAVALASGLGAGRLGALLAIPIVVATGLGPTRLAAYRPEGFALGLTLLVVALCIDWLGRRDWRCPARCRPPCGCPLTGPRDRRADSRSARRRLRPRRIGARAADRAAQARRHRRRGTARRGGCRCSGVPRGVRDRARWRACRPRGAGGPDVGVLQGRARRAAVDAREQRRDGVRLNSRALLLVVVVDGARCTAGGLRARTPPPRPRGADPASVHPGVADRAGRVRVGVHVRVAGLRPPPHGRLAAGA